jgi:hypothetical protein
MGELSCFHTIRPCCFKGVVFKMKSQPDHGTANHAMPSFESTRVLALGHSANGLGLQQHTISSPEGCTISLVGAPTKGVKIATARPVLIEQDRD